MREIKFRVWHTKSNQWHPYPSDLAVRINDGVLVTAVSDKLLSPVSSEFIYQQFTGLKDKNGVEIYEGDVVRAIAEERHSTENVITDIVWHDLQWQVRSPGYEHGLPLTWGGWRSIEVIGNIYENPELLGENK